MQLIKKSALFALVLSSVLICGQQVQAAKPSAAPAQETTLEVKAKLDAFAKSYVARANDTLKNNRQNMSVTKQGKACAWNAKSARSPSAPSGKSDTRPKSMKGSLSSESASLFYANRASALLQ